MLSKAFFKVLYWDHCQFFIYINDLSSDLIFKAKLLADDASPFPVTHDTTTSAKELNSDLKKISDRVFQ